MFLAVWAAMLPSRVLGWGPLAHWLLAKADPEAAPYANIPDAWASNSLPDLGLTIEIAPYFCWSHGVLGTGVMDLTWSPVDGAEMDLNPLEIPKVPVRHPCAAAMDPGRVMQQLLDGRVGLGRRWPASAGKVAECLRSAARGIISHNEMDVRVHWGYFLGATGMERDAEEAQRKWTVHHGLKEAWAEFVLLATQVLKKHELTREDFDASGHVIIPEKTANGSQVEVPQLAIGGLDANGYDNDLIRALAWARRLSQASYNKNRTSRSAVTPGECGLAVQSQARIRLLLAAQDRELRGHFSQPHWARGEILEPFLPMNVQDGKLEVTLLDGTRTTMDYDTPDSLWIEWQMLDCVVNS